MSNLNSALDQLRTWAERNKAILELATALEGVGSVEQLAKEAKAKLAAVNAELAHASAELVGQRELVAEAVKRAEAIEAEAAAEAAKTKSDAAAEAKAARAAAKKRRKEGGAPPAGPAAE